MTEILADKLADAFKRLQNEILAEKIEHAATRKSCQENWEEAKNLRSDLAEAKQWLVQVCARMTPSGNVATIAWVSDIRAFLARTSNQSTNNALARPEARLGGVATQPMGVGAGETRKPPSPMTAVEGSGAVHGQDNTAASSPTPPEGQNATPKP